MIVRIQTLCWEVDPAGSKSGSMELCSALYMLAWGILIILIGKSGGFQFHFVTADAVSVLWSLSVPPMAKTWCTQFAACNVNSTVNHNEHLIKPQTSSQLQKGTFHANSAVRMCQDKSHDSKSSKRNNEKEWTMVEWRPGILACPAERASTISVFKDSHRLARGSNTSTVRSLRRKTSYAAFGVSLDSLDAWKISKTCVTRLDPIHLHLFILQQD